MQIAFRAMAPLLLIAILFVEGATARASSRVLPIPAPRPPRSVLAPKSGVPKSSLTAPTGKAEKKRSWFPFGNRNKRVLSR